MGLWIKTTLIVFLASVIAEVACGQNHHSNMNTEETEILKTVREWNRSFAQNDPERYFQFIHPELSIFLASSPYRIEGKSIDREEFEWSLNTGKTRVSLFQELQPKVHLLSKNSALVTYHTRGVYGPDGQEQMICLKETNVLVKENDKWLIVHIHVSK